MPTAAQTYHMMRAEVNRLHDELAHANDERTVLRAERDALAADLKLQQERYGVLERTLAVANRTITILQFQVDAIRAEVGPLLERLAEASEVMGRTTWADGFPFKPAVEDAATARTWAARLKEK